LTQLGDGHHVKGVVESAVPCPRQTVADLVARRRVDRGGPVVGGEVVLGREPSNPVHFSQDSPGDHRPDSVEVDQASSGDLHQSGDLSGGGFDLGVDRLDVGKVLGGQLEADLGHLTFRT